MSRTDGGSSAGGRVVVVGSANVDLTASVDALPQPGQTVIARQLTRRCGGKGANQAAAAGRLGADVRLVAAVGDDDASEAVRTAAAEAGVRTDRLQISADSPTGTALITVDRAGENSIVVVPGANADLAAAQLAAPLADLTPTDVVVVSLEIAVETAAAALRLAHDAGARTLLNPSPCSSAVADLLADVDVVIVNEGEAADLGAAALDRPDLAVIVTLGGDGSRVRSSGTDGWHQVPAPRVGVVDTTGCGDAFAGAVAAELADGSGLVDAVTVAVRYAALAATAPGAQSSYADRAAFEASGLAG
jgi:ribokinase